MKKFIKKLIVFVSVICLATTFFGCDGNNSGSHGGGGEGGETTNQTLTISIANFGYGIKWLQEIAKVFESANKGVKVDIKPTVLPYSFLDQLNGGLEGYDIFFMIGGLEDAYAKGTFINLDDVMASVPDGETKTIAEKMEPFMRDACVYKKDGHYFSIKWGDSYYCWVVNKTTLDSLFGKNNYQLPRTTDELLTILKDIRTKGTAYGHVFSTADSYMVAAFETWWAQYDFDSYINYFEGMYYNENGELVEANNGESLKAPGKLESLKVCETLMKKSNGYAHQYSNSMSFSEAQAAFLGLGYGFVDVKPVAFMCNAGWLENESAAILEGNPQEIDCVRIPLISKIIEVVPDGSIADDAELAALVQAIDDGKTALNGEGYEVTQADFDYVQNARYRVVNNGMAHNAGILANSKNKELAKKFLKFLASDAASQIYANTMGGLTLPFGYMPTLTNANSQFVRTLTTLKKDNLSLPSIEGRRLTSHGTKIGEISDYNGWSAALFSGTKNAQKIYQEDIAFYTSQWAYLTGKA